MTDETTRIEFAERQGWKRIEPPQFLNDKEVRLKWTDWTSPLTGERLQLKYLPNPTDRNHVHTALMEMSEEEWEKFADVLYCQYILNLEDMSSWSHGAEFIIKALKTPLPTLVSCYLEATKERTKQ